MVKESFRVQQYIVISQNKLEKEENLKTSGKGKKTLGLELLRHHFQFQTDRADCSSATENLRDETNDLANEKTRS